MRVARCNNKEQFSCYYCKFFSIIVLWGIVLLIVSLFILLGMASQSKTSKIYFSRGPRNSLEFKSESEVRN